MMLLWWESIYTGGGKLELRCGKLQVLHPLYETLM